MGNWVPEFFVVIGILIDDISVNVGSKGDLSAEIKSLNLISNGSYFIINQTAKTF